MFIDATSKRNIFFFLFRFFGNSNYFSGKIFGIMLRNFSDFFAIGHLLILAHL